MACGKAPISSGPFLNFKHRLVKVAKKPKIYWQHLDGWNLGLVSIKFPKSWKSISYFWLAKIGVPYQRQPESKILVNYQPKILNVQILILTRCKGQDVSNDKMVDHIYSPDDLDKYNIA